jgi:hypothetical protein
VTEQACGKPQALASFARRYRQYAASYRFQTGNYSATPDARCCHAAADIDFIGADGKLVQIEGYEAR